MEENPALPAMRRKKNQLSGSQPVKVLILYYSLSAQTSGLVHRLGAGLEGQGVHLVCERLQPLVPGKFPIGTVPATLVMMLLTFLRVRMPIQPLSPLCWEDYDLIVLAGPTWSYNPSGPVLSLLDRDGARLFAGRQVLPLISCRGYWRMHWLSLRWQLARCGAKVVGRMIFAHPSKEPWRTIGVFLKLAGRVPERSMAWPLLSALRTQPGATGRGFRLWRGHRPSLARRGLPYESSLYFRPGRAGRHMNAARLP